MDAPGVSFERVDLGRPRVARLRTDICGFLGYAERGPVDRPVKLRSWRQFLDAFGPPLEVGHTGHSVRLFFENGGDACYMMRITDTGAVRNAGAVLAGGAGGALHLSAAYSAIARVRGSATGPTARPAARPVPSPGAWGNRLAVLVQGGGLGATRSLPNQPADGASLRAESIAGFSPGSRVRLVQDGGAAAQFARVHSIDPQLREILWSAPLAGLGLDFNRPVRLETVEFTLQVLLDGQEIARHRDLSLDPDHPRFLPLLLEAESAWLSGTSTLDPAALAEPASWPAPGTFVQLAGGRDGLATVSRHDFLRGLALLEGVDEISVLAAPDLVLRAEAPGGDLAPPLPARNCCRPEAPPEGRLHGIVLDAGTGTPAAGVRVTSRDVAATAVLSDAQGHFTLTGLPLGQVGLRLEKPGHVTLDASAQSFAVLLATRQRFEIAPRSLPPALAGDEIFEVQQAMIAQGASGLYRIALLDVPPDALRIEDLQGWRRRFDSSFAALYWPWLMAATADGAVRMLPPSGAVAGLLARMDLAEGPQRAPANRPLRAVEALSQPVDDPTHALLNDLGINVLRATPERGIAPQGARTLSSDAEWRFLNVRRLVLMIAESIEQAHQWAVFEPNNRVLRDALTHSLNAWLSALWRRGAFAGDSPAAAFAVKCDAENNPPEVVDAGQVVAQIAIAPVRPYEFIRLRLGRTDRLRVQVEE